MTEFKTKIYKKLEEEFVLVSKRILKTNISTNEETLHQYKLDIINTHNALIRYISYYYSKFDTATKTVYKTNLIQIRQRIIRCFENLQFQYHFSELLLTQIEYESEDESELSVIDTANLTITELDTIQEDSENINMADEARNKFITLCAQTLNNKYGGDPLGLSTFLNGIEFLELLAGDNINILVSFIKTRLEGKALEAIPSQNLTIANIKSSLKETIKPDSSKVVEGRILALKFNPTKSGEFTKDATELAEAFQRSLIIEGIPQAKAKSMAIEKTIEICRKSARSETVKAILAAKEFTEPSEVIAKLVVEGNTVYHEKQILSIQKQYRNNNNNRGRGNNRSRGSYGNYNNNRNNYQNNYQGYRNDNYNNQNGGYNNQNGNYNNNYRGNSRGRGNFRGNGRGYNNQNSQYIRVASNQGNEQLPSNNRRAISYNNLPIMQMPLDH